MGETEVLDLFTERRQGYGLKVVGGRGENFRVGGWRGANETGHFAIWRQGKCGISKAIVLAYAMRVACGWVQLEKVRGGLLTRFKVNAPGVPREQLGIFVEPGGQYPGCSAVG